MNAATATIARIFGRKTVPTFTTVVVRGTVTDVHGDSVRYVPSAGSPVIIGWKDANVLPVAGMRGSFLMAYADNGTQWIEAARYVD